MFGEGYYGYKSMTTIPSKRSEYSASLRNLVIDDGASSIRTNHILPPIQKKNKPKRIKINNKKKSMSPSERVFNLSPHLIKLKRRQIVRSKSIVNKDSIDMESF